MPAPRSCPQCGAPIAPDVPGGHCLRCLLGLGLLRSDPPEEDPPASVAEDEFPGYRIVAKIGEGGCGVVYRAIQTEPLRREVAVKAIKRGMDTRSVITRFEAERQALALMDHPNIARVFDAGSTSLGRPFFVMELVEGEPITHYCDRKNLTITQRLDLFLQVCEAVRHAHLKGVVHRDLKPSNILVAEPGGRPTPKVIDFGVARAMNHQRLADQTIYTAFDQFVGTPAYMSPEQAGLTGEDIDARSDIYSLGVLLYELLTGRPPFEPERLRKAAIDEICRIIREEDPTLPSTRLTTLGGQELTATAQQRLRPAKRLVSELRGDLDGIVMKALEKDRNRRYDSASELAADIRRHLRNEPVSARPPGAFYRFRKFARRNRLVLFSAAVILISLLAGLAASSWMYLREKRTRERLEQRAYLSDMNAAARSAMIRVGGLAGTVKFLQSWKKHQPSRRGWEWYYLNGLCHQEILTIQADPAGLWSVSWNPGGQSLATGGSDGRIRIWDSASGRPLDSFSGHEGAVRCVAWSPDGQWLASAGQDQSIRIWNLATKNSQVLVRDKGVTPSVAWSPDGKWLASGGPDGTVKVWSPTDSTLVRTLTTDSPVNAVCWSGDGSRIFACGPRGMTVAWDSASGTRLWHFILESGGELMTAACSPDGRELVTGGNQNSVNFLAAATGKNIISLFDNQNVVLSVAWSPDGKHLASATRGDGRIAIRIASSGGAITREFRGHLGSVRSVAWHPDGSRVASASSDGTVKVWDAVGPPPSTLTLHQPQQAKSLAWSPDGMKLAVGTRRTHAWIRDFTRGAAPIAMDGGYTPWSFAVAWSPDGSRLASAGSDGLLVFDPSTRIPVWQDTHTLRDIRSMAWSPDGTRIAAVNRQRQLGVWNANTGEPWKSITLPPGTTGALAWSPDGRMIAAGAHFGIHLFDGALRTIRSLPGHPEGIAELAWSQDSTRLASAGGDTTVKIWDPHKGKLLLTLSGHGAPVHGLDWSPDGKRLATGAWDICLKIWDTETGLEVCSFDKPAGIVQMIETVAWSPDGRRIAVGDIEGIIGILDASPGWLADSGKPSSAPFFPPADRTITATETLRSLQLFCRAIEPRATNDADNLLNLAWLRATSTFPELRNGPQAVGHVQRAIELVGDRNPGILSILAAAHAEAGDFEMAVATQQKAISLLRKGGESQAPYAAALKLYEARMPFRDPDW